jgi:hypothetical protein
MRLGDDDDSGLAIAHCRRNSVRRRSPGVSALIHAER